MLSWLVKSTLSLLLLNSESQLPFESQRSPPQPLTFQLRHLHGVANTNHIIFHDVPPSIVSESQHTVQTRPTKVHRPSSYAAFTHARQQSMHHRFTEDLRWDEDEVPGPDTTDRETLLELAKMTNNAYVSPGDSEWYNLTDKWNQVRLA